MGRRRPGRGAGPHPAADRRRGQVRAAENSALPASCVDAIKRHKAAQDRERLVIGPAWRDQGLVFTTRIGTPIEPDNLRRSWEKIRHVTGDSPARFHDLRRTCVTLLLDAGTPPHIVREIVGHSAIDVTMTIHSHASLNEKRAAMRRLGERLA